MMREATVDRTPAEKIAIAGGGKIKSSELEREHDRLIWSCDVAVPNTSAILEVVFDAKIGKVVSVKQESATREARA